MNKYRLDDLQIVAAWEPDPPRAPWRPVVPVFTRSGTPALVLWPVHIRGDVVIGYEDAKTSLDDALAEGSAISVGELLGARRGCDLIRRTDGTFAIVDRHEIIRHRLTEISKRLAKALQLIDEKAPAEDIQDAFDGAYLVHPFEPITTTLRAGAATRLRDEDEAWWSQCIDDLDRMVELGGDLVIVRDRPGWKELPHEDLRDSLFHAARAALDDYLRPKTDLEVPVSPEAQVAAIATALWRRANTGASRVALPHALLSKVLAGDPDAVAEARTRLEEDPSWNGLFAMADAIWRLGGESALIPQDVEGMAVAHAKLADLDRFARTLHHLEQLEDGPARSACWRSFLQRTRGLGQWQDTRPWRQGELAANELRNRLDLNGHPIITMSSLAGTNGIFVGVASLSHGEVDAAATQPRNVPPCVFVNERVLSGRHLLGRFAIAHELCHLLMDRSRTSANAWVCETASRRADHALVLDAERRANAFAAYLLAPRDAVRALVPAQPHLQSSAFVEAALRVRAHFGLTATAAAEHLLNCHQGPDAPDAGRDKLPREMRGRVVEAARGERVPGFETDQAIDAGDLGPAQTRVRRGRFARLLRGWVDVGKISPERAASLLGVAPDDVEGWLAEPS